MLDIINLLIVATFGIAVNLAAFAVWRYRVANNLHLKHKGHEYAGALPEHIWKTALGTIFILVSAILLVIQFDELTIGHWGLLIGFTLLAAGMRELLSFENHRINTVRGTVKTSNDTVEQA